MIGGLRACANVDAALSRAEAASRERPADTLMKAVHLPVRQAASAVRGNRPANAVMLLKEARAFEARYTEVMYLRGLAYLMMRESAAAATEFQKIIDHKGASWGARYAQAYVGLARAADQRGDSVAAKQAYRDFLTLWKDADADLPLLLEAKKAYAALR